MKNGYDKRKGEFQHKLYKFIVLIIVFAFCLLILGFIYVEFFSSSKNKLTSANFIFQFNSKRYDYLNQLDRKYYKSPISTCDTTRFYINHISNSLPCTIQYNHTNKTQYETFIDNIREFSNNLTAENSGLIFFAQPFIEFIDIKEKDKIENFKLPRADNIGRFFINESKKKISIALAPISQINMMKPVKSQTLDEFKPIYSKVDLFKDKNKDKIIHFEIYLNNGDLLYVPSYFFIQNESNEGLIIYEYKDSNILTDKVFKILFDDEPNKIEE